MMGATFTVVELGMIRYLATLVEETT